MNLRMGRPKPLLFERDLLPDCLRQVFEHLLVVLQSFVVLKHQSFDLFQLPLNSAETTAIFIQMRDELRLVLK